MLGFAAFVIVAPCARSQCPTPTVVAETRWVSEGTTVYERPAWITADGLGNVYARLY